MPLNPLVLSQFELRYCGGEDYVEVFVDGIALAERLMVADAEIPGGYVYDDTGLGWSEVDGLSYSAFDAEVLAPGVHPHRLLFTCAGCNFAGCGDTWTTVTTTDRTVSFSSFQRPKRELTSVGPVTFALDQFTNEVTRMNNWYLVTFPQDTQRKPDRKARRFPRSGHTN